MTPYEQMKEALRAVLSEEMIYTGAITETLPASGMYLDLVAKIKAALTRAETVEGDVVAKMYTALCGARHALDLLMGDTDPDEETPPVLAMQAVCAAIELADTRAALSPDPTAEKGKP